MEYYEELLKGIIMTSAVATLMAIIFSFILGMNVMGDIVIYMEEKKLKGETVLIKRKSNCEENRSPRVCKSVEHF